MCMYGTFKERNKMKKLCFCWRLVGQLRKQQDPDPLVRGTDPADPDPDLYQNVTNPQHWLQCNSLNIINIM
jgi:hypothetical protein